MGFSGTSWRDIEYDRLSSWPMGFRWLVICIVSAGMLIGSEIVIVGPITKSVKESGVREEEWRDHFLQKKESLFELERRVEKVQKNANSLLRTLELFPGIETMSDLLTMVSGVGARNGLRFNQLTPHEKQKKEFHEIYPVTIDLSGSYLQLIGFLTDLTNASTLITVETLEVKRSENGLSIKATLVGYGLGKSETADQDGE